MLRSLEDHLGSQESKWLVGDNITLADVTVAIYVARGLKWVLGREWRQGHPRVMGHWKMVSQWEPTIKVVAEHHWEFCEGGNMVNRGDSMGEVK